MKCFIVFFSFAGLLVTQKETGCLSVNLTFPAKDKKVNWPRVALTLLIGSLHAATERLMLSHIAVFRATAAGKNMIYMLQMFYGTRYTDVDLSEIWITH